MDTVLSPADESARKRLTYLALALVVLAIVGPLLALALGLGTQEWAASVAGGAIASLLLLRLISWLVTRNRSRLAQANGRVVVGLLLCIFVGQDVARTYAEELAAKTYLDEAVKFRDERDAAFSKLGERFAKLDLGTVLTPDGVGTPDGLANSRAVVAQYKALLAERNSLVQTYKSKERLIHERLPEGRLRAAAMAGFTERSEATARFDRSLGTAQAALIDSIERVLDWGDAQAGQIGVERGQLVFTRPEQQTELQALVAKVNEAEKLVDAEVETATTAQTKGQAETTDQNRRGQEYIRK